jgi:putative PIN family toxin of toxin-antitoxin system
MRYHFLVRIVLDTNVVVAALRSPLGGSAELVRRIDEGKATNLLTVALALEYEALCTMAEHRLASGLSAVEAKLYVDTLVEMAEPVSNFFRWRPQLRDPGDELVLEAAINGQGDAIVTFNEKDFSEARTGFDIQILRPGAVLRRLKS